MASRVGMCGGFGSAQTAGEEEQTILDSVKTQVEEKLGTTISELTAITYTTQVVAGINYLIKATIAPDDYILVKIHKPLPFKNENPSLMELIPNQTLDSPLL